jgi:hypothetical protein
VGVSTASLIAITFDTFRDMADVQLSKTACRSIEDFGFTGVKLEVSRS